jgi:hypothetical protein
MTHLNFQFRTRTSQCSRRPQRDRSMSPQRRNYYSKVLALNLVLTQGISANTSLEVTGVGRSQFIARSCKFTNFRDLTSLVAPRRPKAVWAIRTYLSWSCFEPKDTAQLGRWSCYLSTRLSTSLTTNFQDFDILYSLVAPHRPNGWDTIRKYLPWSGFKHENRAPLRRWR